MQIRKLLILLLFMLPVMAMADNAADAKAMKKLQKQKKTDIENVRTSLKTGKNLEQSEAVLRRYIADSLFSEEKTLYLLLSEVVRKEYEALNEKVYLKQQIDTAKIMNSARTMFLAYQSLDSIDGKPDDKGNVSLAYRRKNAEFLLPYRNNLFNGGLYFMRQSRWQEAWQCLDAFLDTRRQPLFDGQTLDESNDRQAAFTAFMAAKEMDDMSKACKYITEALQYEPQREQTMILMTMMAEKHDEDSLYHAYLRSGFSEYPANEFFFPHLIDYYVDREQYDEALRSTEEALQTDSLNELFLLSEHTILMTMERYDEALAYGQRLLSSNDTLAIVNYNVAYILYLRAHNAMKAKNRTYKQRLKEAQKWYEQCYPFMERYRALCPDERQRWRPVLYDAYLNLNMGKEFAEIEALAE